jgi:gamma-D-glutamyl-L-lysine dipeptidyl-peptidase
VEYGLCNLSVIPIRSSPDDKSEMVSQLLFGETFKILSAKQQWRKVKCTHDQYEGWIDEKQYLQITRKELTEIKKNSAFSLDLAQSVTNHNHHIPIVIGSSLPFYDGINFKLGKKKYWYNGQAYRPDVQNHKPLILEKIALKFQYAPYLWGGRSPFGVDCSGLVQVVFKILGVSLPRDAWQQAEKGETLSFIGEAKQGDLAFFENKSGNIAHVGIILSQNRIIHAWGRVRIDNIDHFGIYNKPLKKYTHQLKLLKRIL